MNGIVFEPMIPVLAIAAMAGAALALAGYGYLRGAGHVPSRRRAALAALRGLGIVAIAILLMKPMRLRPAEGGAQKPALHVLLDTSRSMNTEDVDGASRLDAEKDALCRAAGLLEALAKDYEVELCEFAEKASATSVKDLQGLDRATGGRTAIGECILGVLNRGARPGADSGGLLLFSDGRDNGTVDAEEAARQAKSLGVPLWTCCLGAKTQAKDIALVGRKGCEFVFANQESAIEADIIQQGYAGDTVTVRLLRQGGKAAATQTAQLTSEPKQRVRFPILEREKGLVKYTLRVEPMPGEANPDNNERKVLINVIAEKLKVLLLDGAPSWDSKFLAQALRQDPKVSLTSVFRMSHNRYHSIVEGAETDAARPSQESGIPETRDALSKFDIIILGRVIDSMVDDDYVDLLKGFLTERGGSLILARGKPRLDGLKGLAEVEPVEWGEGGGGEFLLDVTTEGWSNPAFALAAGEPADVLIRKLPKPACTERVVREKSLATVLARARGEDAGGGAPVIVFRRYGKGKVVSISADGLWRWAFLPDRLREYDTVYGRFWGQMLRWLASTAEFMPGSDVAFHTGAASYSLGEEVRFYVRSRFSGQDVEKLKVEVTAPGGKTSEVRLYADPDLRGACTGSYFPSRQGEHTAVLRGAGSGEPDRTAIFDVYADAVEDMQVAADPELMKRLAEISGGAVLDPSRVERLAGLLRARREAKEERVERVEIWDRGVVFWLLAGVFGLEWFFRRREGLH